MSQQKSLILSLKCVVWVVCCSLFFSRPFEWRYIWIYIYGRHISGAAFPFANLDAAAEDLPAAAGRKEVSVGAYVLWDVRNVEIMTHCVKMAPAHITLESERERKAFSTPNSFRSPPLRALLPLCFLYRTHDPGSSKSEILSPLVDEKRPLPFLYENFTCTRVE